jgi:hypothetical protein
LTMGRPPVRPRPAHDAIQQIRQARHSTLSAARGANLMGPYSTLAILQIDSVKMAQRQWRGDRKFCQALSPFPTEPSHACMMLWRTNTRHTCVLTQTPTYTTLENRVPWKHAFPQTHRQKGPTACNAEAAGQLTPHDQLEPPSPPLQSGNRKKRQSL